MKQGKTELKSTDFSWGLTTLNPTSFRWKIHLVSFDFSWLRLTVFPLMVAAKILAEKDKENVEKGRGIFENEEGFWVLKAAH